MQETKYSATELECLPIVEALNVRQVETGWSSFLVRVSIRPSGRSLHQEPKVGNQGLRSDLEAVVRSQS